MQLRIAVKNFIQNSKHPNANNFKAEYQKISLAMNENWVQYWARLIQDQVQVDYTFIQSTAWYLKHDIMIVNTTNNDDNPVIIISGNIADETQACPGAMLTIGSKSNSHFQSLLPIEIFHLNSEARTQITHADYEGDNNESIEPYLHPIENEKKSTINSSQNKIPGFIYKNENTDIEFLIGPDGLIQCYSCKKFCKSLIQHLRMNKQCKEGIVIDDLKIQYHIFNSEAHKQKKRTHQIKSRQVKLENNPAGLKRAEKDRQDKSRQRKAEMDPVGKSMAEIKWQTKSRQVKLENNPGGF